MPVASHFRVCLRPCLVRASRKRGQTLVEYALILAVLTVVMIASMHLLGTQLIVIFSSITGLLDTAQSS